MCVCVYVCVCVCVCVHARMRVAVLPCCFPFLSFSPMARSGHPCIRQITQSCVSTPAWTRHQHRSVMSLATRCVCVCVCAGLQRIGHDPLLPPSYTCMRFSCGESCCLCCTVFSSPLTMPMMTMTGQSAQLCDQRVANARSCCVRRSQDVCVESRGWRASRSPCRPRLGECCRIIQLARPLFFAVVV